MGEQFRGHGAAGYHLLTELCHQAEKAGYWTLQSTVLQGQRCQPRPAHKMRLSLEWAAGERIARDCHGRWLDTFLMGIPRCRQ